MTRTGPTHVHPIEAMGHLAVWAGCYAVGCVLFVAAVVRHATAHSRNGGGLSGPRRAPTCSTGSASVVDCPIGPMSRRCLDEFTFLRRRIPGVRAIALALLVAALALVASEGWLAGVTVPAAVCRHAPVRIRPGRSKAQGRAAAQECRRGGQSGRDGDRVGAP